MILRPRSLKIASLDPNINLLATQKVKQNAKLRMQYAKSRLQEMLQDKQPSFFNNNKKKWGQRKGGDRSTYLLEEMKTHHAIKMCQPYLDPNLEKL